MTDSVLCLLNLMEMFFKAEIFEKVIIRNCLNHLGIITRIGTGQQCWANTLNSRLWPHVEVYNPQNNEIYSCPVAKLKTSFTEQTFEPSY
jgi:hypothetical protein